MSLEMGWRPTEGEILSVSELLGKVRSVAETLFADIWVEGEISDLKIPYSGHAYFTVGDEGGKLRAVCFKNTLRLLDHHPREGMEVLIRGRLSVYEPRGDLQLIADYISPVGEGLARLRLEELKKKLKSEGLFDPERKRPLPPMPRAVAVVTSASGAALQDILKVLKRRAPWLDVYISPTLVQGESAPESLVKALFLANEVEKADLIILGRGGGSGEDLSAFNDEGVARAVAASRLPVISAVGHETDFTLTDFCADQRAPTPSAAAELAVREGAHWLSVLKRSELLMAAHMRETIFGLKERLNAADPKKYDPERVIERRRLKVDALLEGGLDSLQELLAGARGRLGRADLRLSRLSPETRAGRAAAALSSLEARLLGEISRKIDGLKAKNTRLFASLESLNPEAVLSRGYAVVTDAEGRVVCDASTRKEMENIFVKLQKGSLDCRITKTRP